MVRRRLVLAFDQRVPTVRHEAYAEYTGRSLVPLIHRHRNLGVVRTQGTGHLTIYPQGGAPAVVSTISNPRAA